MNNSLIDCLPLLGMPNDSRVGGLILFGTLTRLDTMVIKRIAHHHIVIGSLQHFKRIYDLIDLLRCNSRVISSSPVQMSTLKTFSSPVPITVCCRRLMRVDCRSKNTEQSIRLTESEIFLGCGWEQLLVVLSAMTINTIRIRAEISMPLVRSLQISTTRRTWVSRAVVVERTHFLLLVILNRLSLVRLIVHKLLSSIERSIGSVKAFHHCQSKSSRSQRSKRRNSQSQKTKERRQKPERKKKLLRFQKRTQLPSVLSHQKSFRLESISKHLNQNGTILSGS